MLFEISEGAVPASAFFNPNSIQFVGGKGAGSFIYILDKIREVSNEKDKSQLSLMSMIRIV